MPGARRLMAIRADGKTFVCHTPTGLWSLEPAGPEKFISSETLGGAGVFLMERDARGWLIATTDGLQRFEGGRLTAVGSDEVLRFIRKNVLICACRSKHGELYLGTLYGGLAVVNPSGNAIEKIITAEDGLPSRGIFSLFESQDGAVWATSATGIARIALNAGVTLFDSKQGLTGKACVSTVQSGNQILVATMERVFGLSIASDSSSIFYPIPKLDYHYNVLEKGPHDTVYASGFKRVDRIEKGEVTEVLSSKTDLYLFRPSSSVPGTFLAIEAYEIERVAETPGPAISVVRLARLPDLPTSFAEDIHGNFWIGTYARGAFFLSHPSDRPVTPVRLKTGNSFADAGRIYVASVGDHVAVFTAKGVELFSDPSTPSEALEVAPKTEATAVSNIGPSGAVWAAFESPFADGMRVPVVGALAAPSGGVPSWTPFSVPGVEQIGQISSIFVDDRGIVWLGGMDGMLRLAPGDLKPVEAPHLPVIRASVGFGEKLPAKRNSVSFDFSAVEYTMRGSVRFETKLSGGLDEWSAPTNNNHLGLAGLQNGTYEFSVRAVNDAGMAGPTATWSFTVLPPWYRTLPALIAFVLVLAAAVFGAFRWRLAFLKRQNVRLEILVQKKTEQLQKANEAKSEFLANMSHEIRNPISGILGLSLAFQETKLEGRQRQILDSISSCATLLATLVDDVLDFSKIEAGTIELRSAPFNLRGLLEQCVAMMAETARAAGAGITVTVAPELPEQIVGDSARVQQIILNYVTNALKFGAGKPIVLGASKGFHDRVRFFVRDQGAGMTAAEIATLFTKFTRLESARAGNIRGTGLGLAVCKLLATKMGGRVGVDSKPGEGSCFWAEIPFLTVYGVAQGEAPQVRAGTTLRALIVEDIDYNVIAMQAVLRKLDIQSDVVNDGNEALARLQATHYDVAFLDWNLPGIIGTEVAARYRAVEPSTQRTIIIATTAHSSDFNKEACLQAGMDAFISKPITPAKIAAALRDLGGPMRTAASIEVRSQNITFEPPGEIDLEMLTFLGSETLEGLAGQIDNFLAAFDNDRVSARHIIANGAPTEIHRIAHRLLSHCSVVKYEALSRLARNIQNSSATASRAELQRMFGEFETEFSSFRYKLESIRASTGSV